MYNHNLGFRYSNEQIHTYHALVSAIATRVFNQFNGEPPDRDAGFVTECCKVKSNRWRCGNTRRPAARSPATVSARRAPTEPRRYSHQLPPVRPITSPFSEFHRKLFHPPSSLLEGILDFFFFFLCPVKVVPLLDFLLGGLPHQVPNPRRRGTQLRALEGSPI